CARQKDPYSPNGGGSAYW
nr:immunoglobulin heavy chain junction region [Mus musculus]